MELTREREENREMLTKILHSVRFLACQGIALRGHNDEASNFMQLMKLQGLSDSRIMSWLERKSNKYTSHEIQNELLKIMALSVLRDIATNLQNGVPYTLMAEEVTDSSNREQFVIRWVDSGLIAHEDLLGLYQVPDISSATLVQCLQDVLTTMSLSINNCRGQCYDGANNMSGIRSGVATQILKEEERALFTHCYGHALNLAVSDTVRKVKLLHDTLDTTSEISKLLKYSPKRDTMFEKLKKELAPETPGFRTLCPTRWTVKANSLKSVLDNFKPLTQLWEDSLETNLNSEIKSRIIGMKTQMRAFDYFFRPTSGVHGN